MNEPVGWVVLARPNIQEDVFVLGVIDIKYANDEEAALESAKSRIKEDHSSWRITVFGVTRLEQRTKFNLAAALRRLNLPGYDMNAAYDSLVAYLEKEARTHDS